MKKKKNSFGITILILVTIIFACIMIFRSIKTKKDNEEKDLKYEDKEEKISQKGDILIGEIDDSNNIFDGNERPIAVMLDNHKSAWPHYSLQQAYLTYEIVVEGGETRLMALFKGKDISKIGPVRSARHYFIDYAMENDAIYVHFGQSPQAQNDIKKFHIDEINGISKNESAFWRIKDKKAPHNAVTSTDKILKEAKREKMRLKSDAPSVLRYAKTDLEIKEGIEANEITIPHSSLQTVKYVYNKEKKFYERYARNQRQNDAETGDIVTTKNIIITFCDNYTLKDEENKGRQGLKNIGVFDGYYITNGKAIKIKCEKKSREKQTKYYDENDNEININNGNTFISICPTKSDVLIK